MFIKQQKKEEVETYIELLQSIGSLSRLFSENKVPYLAYRAHENIFCKAFNASNEGRGDIAVDAVKNKTGIGLKTFLHRNSQFEKVAEFNKLLPTYNKLEPEELISVIAEARNERIQITERIYGLNDVIYHCVSRKAGSFCVFECPMPLINLDSIKKTKDDGKTVQFSDGTNEYKFSRSKSTLFKKFTPTETLEFPVEIIEDPYEAILSLSKRIEDKSYESVLETVVLPLYSHKEGIVHPKSGLNQWNAGGRARNKDEVYIPVPAWIHKKFDGFFPPKDKSFDLVLPNGDKMSAKICQAGGKALMSNPNVALGKWILRDILQLKPGEVLTMEKLIKVGIDSVRISKVSDTLFQMDFAETDSFEEFNNEVN